MAQRKKTSRTVMQVPLAFRRLVVKHSKLTKMTPPDYIETVVIPNVSNWVEKI